MSSPLKNNHLPSVTQHIKTEHELILNTEDWDFNPGLSSRGHMNKKSLRVESSIYYQYLPPEVLE
jgi:hypothetical protein